MCVCTYNKNNPIVKHISDQSPPVNINNATTVKIMKNIRQRKVIETFFLIKQVTNMNVYHCKINFEQFTFSILFNNVPMNPFKNYRILWRMVRFFYMIMGVCMFNFSFFFIIIPFLYLIYIYSYNCYVYLCVSVCI